MPTSHQKAAVALIGMTVVIMAAAITAHGGTPADDDTLAVGAAHAQEIELATFHESAVVLVDRTTGMHSTTASITLQSVSTHEMRIPPDLERQIREDGLITAVILTNQERCIPGVADNESCIVINTERDRSVSGIVEVQGSAQETADRYIGALNDALGTDARFHSVFIHGGSETSDLAAGLPVRASLTVSVVYVMPMEDTGPMHEKISAVLLPSAIRDAGGFHHAAKKMSAQEGARVSFALVPLADRSLMQLKVISDRGADAPSTDVISPLGLMGLDALERSGYLAGGFYPLNSVVQVAISSADPDTAVTGSSESALPTRLVEGEMVPVDVTTSGWVFDPPNGRMILAKYIFGERAALAAGDLEITLGKGNGSGAGQAGDPLAVKRADMDTMVLVAVVATAAAVAAFYLRGYSGRSRKK